MSRIAELAARARYRDWHFDASRPPTPPGLVALRIVDPDGRVERLGPWPLPADAGEAEVCAAAMLAVAEVEGPDAVAGLEWRPGVPDAAGAGATLRRLRLVRGWDLARLAAESGVSPDTLYFVESGRTKRPRATTAARLAVALGVDVHELRPPD